MRLTSSLSILSVALAIGAGGAGSVGTPGCKRAPAPTAAAYDVLDVSFAGCAAVTAAASATDAATATGAATATDEGVTCELAEPRSLRLAVPKAARAVEIRTATVAAAAGLLLPSRAEDAGGSILRHVEVPPEAERLVVTGVIGERAARFELRLAKVRTMAWLDEAKALRGKGDLARARTLAAAHLDAVDDAERAGAKDLLARIALAEGHADEAFPLLREAIAAHRAANRLSEHVDDSFALAFALHQRSHRYDEARAALDAIGAAVRRYPEGRAREPYYRGILASETGDRRSALALLRESESRARALGMTRLERNARAALALEMQVLGRVAGSLDVLRGLARDPEVKGCERVEVENDLGWGALLANEAAGDAHEDARAPLERAVAVEGCADAYLKSFALGNLARLALRDGRRGDARTLLERARAAVKEPRGTERLSWLDLEARILLADGEPAKALARFDEEGALARAGVLLEPEWSALVGRAEALEALARRGEAVKALLAAEDILGRAMLLVPLGEGRGAFVSDRSQSARAAIDLLVSLDRNADGARVARASRARILSSVERALRIEALGKEDRVRWETAVRGYRAAREALDAEAASDWKLPADALGRVAEARKQREKALAVSLEAAMAVLAPSSAVASPSAAGSGSAPAVTTFRDEVVAAGDLDIVVHPGRHGWTAFVSEARTTSAHRVPAPSASHGELAAALLEPIATRILASRRVRVRAYGSWRSVDVHALALRGVPLLDHVAVDYPLGVRAETDPAAFERRAVIVGDPRTDLPGARAEATRVGAALQARMPARLIVGAEATSRVVADQLSRAGFFHYAGHGVFAESEGLASSLPLAEGGSLSAGDFFALAPAPRKVVLSGCDAARSTGGAEDFGLGQALVAAGAEEVLAPIRPVSDALAEKLAAALYAGSAGEALGDLSGRGTLATAARSALKQLREEAPGSDWQAFRVLAR